MIKQFLFLGLTFLFVSCKSTKVFDKSYTSNNIVIKKVKDHVYQHTTFLETADFGKVPCNGMIVFEGKEAIIFDTPVDDATSEELISWVKDSLDCKVKAIIPTHFHYDCLGGLGAFHKQGIPSYALNRTVATAKSKNYPTPKNSFDSLLTLKVGNKEVIAEFNGEGHTRDNIIGYFPSERIMFGGCLVKELNAGKGNLEDANVNDWSETVTKLKGKYADTEVVIPGHGKLGDKALLDYTVQLFEQRGK
ncbi:MAG TPA: subclass B1 metallo-beta-lactamase [Pseudosphingobacterium sp.]|nr:subclass B1 metallo-beta-lactamase [Pseudosphingobacterium sp.]